MSDVTNQVNRINVQGTDYSFGASRAKAVSSSASDAADKQITVGNGYTIEEGVCLSVKFEHGNSYGNVWNNYLYSTDSGATLYTDPECTELAELAPASNRFIEYSGEENRYNYYVFPTISFGSFSNIPVCDCRGHYAGKGCWNDGDKITFYFDGEAALIQNTDIRQVEETYTVKADGRTEYTREEVDVQITNGRVAHAIEADSASSAGSCTEAARDTYGTTQNLDLRSKNDSYWYPCIMYLSPYKPTRIMVDYALEGVKPSWATHNGGYSCHQDFMVIGNAWGTNTLKFYNHIVDNYTWSKINPVSAGQLYRSSRLVLWLRGGGVYHVHIDGYRGSTFTIYDSYSDGQGGSVSKTTSYPTFGTQY